MICKRLKELGGGTTLDIGVYNVQFTSLVMGGQRPEKIVAAGILNDDAVDDGSSATLIYPGRKVATIVTSGRSKMDNSAYIYGTEGTLKVVKGQSKQPRFFKAEVLFTGIFSCASSLLLIGSNALLVSSVN